MQRTTGEMQRVFEYDQAGITRVKEIRAFKKRTVVQRECDRVTECLGYRFLSCLEQGKSDMEWIHLN